MYAKEEGQNIDHAELGERIHTAVAEVVAKQRKAGIDLINDGEVSKPSYATYVKDRLSGFGGTGNTFVYQDLGRISQPSKARLRRSRAIQAQNACVQRANCDLRRCSSAYRCGES
jgi:methionine synthase II (cobalamin-independent)